MRRGTATDRHIYITCVVLHATWLPNQGISPATKSTTWLVNFHVSLFTPQIHHLYRWYSNYAAVEFDSKPRSRLNKEHEDPTFTDYRLSKNSNIKTPPSSSTTTMSGARKIAATKTNPRTPAPNSTPPPVPVVYSDGYFTKMRAFVMTPERLKIEGYKLENLGKDEILGFRRCRDCHGWFSFD